MVKHPPFLGALPKDAPFKTPLVAALLWTLLVSGSLAWNIDQEKQQTKTLAINAARTHFNKDLVFQLWVSAHGGVYVPVSEETPPNPLLSHLPERDIQTPSGRPLTLMNPAYILRQMMNEFPVYYGGRGRMTSLNPLNPDNAPDSWERTVLSAFETGQLEEALLFTEEEGKPVLRLMKPMILQENCLKCHIRQGYEEGGAPGAIGVSVPLTPYLAHERNLIVGILWSHLLFWLIGLAGVTLLSLRQNQRRTERERAQARLEQSEAKFQTLALVLPVGVAETDPEGACRYVNNMWLQLIGLADAADVVGNLWTDWVHEGDRERITGLWRAACQDDAPFSAEFRIVTADGGMVWILGQASGQEDGSGNPLGHVVTFTDINDRRLAEETAREAQQFSNSVIESLAGVFYLFDQEGFLVRWNDNFQKITGYANGELPHKFVLDFIPESERPLIGERIQTVFSEGSATVEGGLLAKTGETIPHFFTGTRVEIGGKRYLSGVGFDITERKEMEVALLAEQALIQGSIDALKDTYFLFDPATGQALRWNKAFRVVSGYGDQEIARLKAPESYYSVEDLEKAGQAMAEMQAQGRATVQISLICKSGATIPFEYAISPLQSSDRPLIISIGRDISDRKRMEDRLRTAKERAEAATRTKSAFLAAMSHEIRTPMNAILGMVELLKETELNQTQAWCVKTLNRSGEALLTLINDILDLSKIESGHLTLERIPLDLPLAVGEIMDLFAFTALDKGIELTSEIDEQVPQWVLGDPTRLRQVLLNLVGNAVKFTKRGTVEIRVRKGSQDRIAISVRDTGPGVSPEKREEIFQPFTQADSSITRAHGGTGLGLAICRRLVELQGGGIRLESRLQHGSAFTFTIPFPATEPPAHVKPGAAAGAPADHAASQSPGVSPSTALKILLVDDAEDNRLLVQAFLKKSPHSIVMAENGAEAMDRFQSERFDLVLMDIQMPIMDGYQATRAIRAWEAERDTPPTPIIALTAHAMLEESEQIKAAGCDLHLTKPIKRTKLLETIERFRR